MAVVDGSASSEGAAPASDEVLVGDYRLVYDPFDFRIEDLVATIDSHAAELVVDDDGSEWVSHCGWGQGGVHLAPFEWRRVAQ